jgi:NOL1/NOP2/fmu family ribosome biogenesis protein
LQFLRKQDLSAGLFVEGMNLVVCRGQALGFVKRIGNRVNNLYPNSLRILK